MILFLHTDTTGLWRFRKSETDPSQPHMVRVAAALVQPGAKEPAERLTRIIRPLPGWTFEPGAVGFHGITPELADSDGFALRAVIAALQRMAAGATMIAGWSVNYQVKVVQRAAAEADTTFAADAALLCVKDLAIRRFRTSAVFKLPAAYEKCMGAKMPVSTNPLQAGADMLDATIAVYRALAEARP